MRLEQVGADLYADFDHPEGLTDGGTKNHERRAKRALERIEKVRPAMMTTAEVDGSFRSRPMWTQGDEFDGSLWFFVSDDGPLARELERNPRVGLSYAAPDKDLYVSVSGRAALVHDRAKADKLWNTYAQAWFPEGVDDPHLGLLRVDVEQAQYWEDTKPKILQFAEILVGAVTGRPPKSGDEAKLDFER